MRIALISDIHGNLFGLQAALEAIEKRGYDRLVCLGDTAAFGPQPRETLSLLRTLECTFVMGNTDAWLLDPKPHAYRDENTKRVTDIEMWCADQLTSLDLDFVSHFMSTIELPLTNTESLLCFHGSPKSFSDVIRATTPENEIGAMLAGHENLILAGGHTHSQMLRRFGRSYLINPGSVGLPHERMKGREGYRTPPWAEYAIITAGDSEDLSISLERIPYDIEPLMTVAQESGMPHAEWWCADWQIA